MFKRLVFSISLLTPLAFSTYVEHDTNNYQHVCQTIASKISSKSAVYYPGSKAYKDDIFHWASTNTAHSACSVEPGSTKDVGRILHILGESRTPFGVKSGGHTVNPGFSSSPGVQIALTRFNEIKYDSKTQTVEIGAGLIFDDVYAALERYNVSVAGGRISGIGVGGFILGGGYSWKTNRFGLALDNTVAYELVMPNGNVVKVTESSYPDLFFGLKGGYNNFGIVTQFTMKALPQPAIWAGPISYPASSVPDVTKAIIKFSATNDDPKANMVFATGFTNGETVFSGLIFYDGPRPPRGLFDDFLNIPSVSRSIHERTLTDFIKDASMAAFNGYRGIYHTVPLLKLSPNVMAAILNETAFWSAAFASKGGLVSHTVEPFLPSILSHNARPSAYPPTRDHVYLPLNLNYEWQNAEYDEEFFDSIRQTAARIRDVTIKDGQDIVHAPLYPNYALFSTPLRFMYGDNVHRLASLKHRIDPHDVMGLAGGFKF